MKNLHLIPIAALVLFAATGCDKQSSDVAKKITELEQKNQAAADRQRELEQELEDQKLASERDAIERERTRIEEDRAELERQQGEDAAAQDAALHEREDALYNREGKLEQYQAALEDKEDDIQERTQQLSERDQELAGREALAFEEPEQSEPVADYDMFYDSLSSYGSWFETEDYGYVWQPVVVRESNWRPYARGRWACSDRGWTWISEEPFGWATYHYGRWALLRGHGWIWVPGTEWAPCWVSWREGGSHIGWAPLPPETLAYAGHNWDSSVDVQFGIGAMCYNFVEIGNFGSSLYGHCLPISGNDGCFSQTTNITFIHIENRQVICGGPKYKNVCDRIGKPLPFYRLEIDRHPRPSRDSLAMRPRVKDGRLLVSAPNMDVAWNDSLRPKRIKERIETVTVERNGNLGREITDRYRKSREDGRQKSENAVVELGGVERFDQRREEKMQDNRRQVDGKGHTKETREIAKNPERPQRDNPVVRERVESPADEQPEIDQVPDQIARQTNETRPRAEALDDRRNSAVNDAPQVNPAAVEKQRQDTRPQRRADDTRAARNNEAAKQVETRREQQRPADQAAPARKENVDRRQQEQNRQEQQETNKRRQDDQDRQRQQQEKQREAEQDRQAQQEANRQQREQERAQRQQQELAQQREQERAQRQQQEQAQQRERERAQRQQQQQEEQQREMQRQQERAEQRQQEEVRQRQQEQAQQRDQERAQRQQEENQRQQENARQRQQEDNQRQQRQEESRQKQEKDQDDQRKRGK